MLEKFGARYLVSGEAGNVVEVLEGDWAPKKLTVIEFPSRARAKEFFGPREFREIVGLRHESAKTNLVLIGDLKADEPRLCGETRRMLRGVVLR